MHSNALSRMLLALALLCLFTLSAHGQGAFISPQTATGTINGALRALPGATITVCSAGASGIPCSPVSVGVLFKDIGLTIPLSNPFLADSNGNYQFAIAPGTYTVTVTAAGFAGTSSQVTVSCLGASNCNANFSGAITFSGPVSHSGMETFSGPLTVSGAATLCLENNSFVAGSSCYPTIQAAINAAALLTPCGSVWIPATYNVNEAIAETPGINTYPNGAVSNCVQINDGRQGSLQLQGSNDNGWQNISGGSIRSLRPTLDNLGTVVPFGSDILMVSEGAADVHIRTLDLTRTSSTSVGSTGLATITLAGATCSTTVLGITTNTITNCLYPGTAGHLGASIDIDNCYKTNVACAQATDAESLSPATTGCPNSPPSGQFCIAGASTITGNFTKTHTVTPYTITQRGGIFLDSWQFATYDTNSSNPVFGVQHFGNNLANREYRITQLGGGFTLADSGDGSGNHINRFYGDCCNKTPGGITYLSNGGSTSQSTWEWRNNNVDNTVLARMDTAGSFITGGGFFPLSDLGQQIGTTALRFNNVVATKFTLSEAAAPAGVANATVIGADSTTHTPSWNVNNTSVSSPTGAWQCTNVTPVTVNANVSTDQNLMSCSVPAGTLNRVGRTLRIWLAGVYSTPAASSTAIVVKAKLGALTLATWTSTALGGIQATNDQFNVTARSTTQTAGAAAAFEVHGNLDIDLGIGNTIADTNFADVNTATVGNVDTTAIQTLQITIAFTVASASNTATQRQLVVETIN